MIKRNCAIVFLFLLSISVYAQLNKSIDYKLESGITSASGEHAPLWLTANKQGLSSIRKNNGFLRAGVFCKMDSARKYSYGYGVEVAAATGFTSKMVLQQAYADIRLKKMVVSIGSKERQSEMVNAELSSGGLTLSGNARPIPQVRVGLPQYVMVPGTNKWLSCRGHVAYGCFTDGSWQREFAGSNGNYNTGVLYHSKSLFLKTGKPQLLPLTFEIGIQMEAQFGGKRYSNGDIHKVKTTIKDYFKVLVPMAGGENTPVSDQTNIEGNQLGSYHISLNYHLKGWRLHTYFEHYFEDHSMLTFQYGWRDGLMGVEITPPANRFVSGVVYECMGSKDQAGAVYWDHNDIIDQQISARDNYYNHGFYGAWQHWGMALGNPLFRSPIYNEDGTICFKSNRIIAHHLGISGAPTSELRYRLLLSRTDNWGTYSTPFKEIKRNTSSLIEVSYAPQRFSGWSITAAAATDRGDMLGNNWGGMVTLRKVGLLAK